MEELKYNELLEEIIQKLQSAKEIILATCADNKVTARMMCPLNDGLTIMFGTNKNSTKIKQIKQNPNIALAIENLKIEAIAEIFGSPKRNTFFNNEYPKKYPHLGDTYPENPDDILIIAKPVKISLFKYIGKPCEDILEIKENKAYRL
jgi:uncharacterized pyridoxamine 5'-phosphate oxidase family protein